MRFRLVAASPRKKTISVVAVRLELEPGLQGAAGIETGADPLGERLRAGERRRMVERAVAAEELRPVACP